MSHIHMQSSAHTRDQWLANVNTAICMARDAHSPRRRRSFAVLILYAAAGWATLGMTRGRDTRSQHSVPLIHAALAMSSASAIPGQRIAVAVRVDPITPRIIGTVDAQISFDPRMLRYVGQVMDSSRFAIVNAKDESRGQLRIIIAGIPTLEPQGLRGRVATLTFEVLETRYSQRLALTVHGAVSRDLIVSNDSSVAAAAEDPTLSSSPISGARRLQFDDWRIFANTMQSRVDARGSTSELDVGVPERGPHVTPATIAPTESLVDWKFGDVNGDGSITLTDALIVFNWSTGAWPMPSFDNDSALAGNVLPFPGTPDVIRAGWPVSCAAALTSGDGQAIINESVGIDQPAVGEPIGSTPHVPAVCACRL